MKRINSKNELFFNMGGSWNEPGKDEFAFGVYGGATVVWHECREQFARIWKSNQRQSFIFLAYADTKTIKKFLASLETKLRIKKKSDVGPLVCGNRTGFYGSWVRVSSWWKQNALRRSFLTLAIKARVFHGEWTGQRGGSVASVILRSEYGDSYDTKPAIRLFLSGYTKEKGKRIEDNHCGWCEIFDTLSSSEAKKLLKKCA